MAQDRDELLAQLGRVAFIAQPTDRGGLPAGQRALIAAALSSAHDRDPRGKHLAVAIPAFGRAG